MANLEQHVGITGNSLQLLLSSLSSRRFSVHISESPQGFLLSHWRVFFKRYAAFLLNIFPSKGLKVLKGLYIFYKNEENSSQKKSCQSFLTGLAGEFSQLVLSGRNFCLVQSHQLEAGMVNVEKHISTLCFFHIVLGKLGIVPRWCRLSRRCPHLATSNKRRH